jgi:HPt (histidine-containing phosphotransfer) domain-containing protein
MDHLPLIDEEQLDIVIGGDTEGMDEIFQDAIVDIRERFQSMSIAEKAGDHAVVTSEAHQVKGLSGSFGFARFAAIFSEVEEKSGRNEEAFTDSVKEEAEKLFLETLGALKAIYPELIPELP